MQSRQGSLAGTAGWILGALGLVLGGALSGARAQTPDAPTERTVIGEAEIGANDVYVRSGDSLNHYTICKLKAGDKVSVVAERGEWYEILPPEGTFSLISGDYVDTTDNQKGIVNGNNVRVRAGSLLNENKYTVQALLSKGVEVTILGRNPDGFLRIKPPAGATVWVNKSFAQMRSTDGAPKASGSEATGATGAVDSTKPEATPTATPDGAAGAAAKPNPVPSATPTIGTPGAVGEKRKGTRTGDDESWKKKLAELDSAVDRELAKPAGERQFDTYVSRYREVVDQAGNEMYEQYARRRIEELTTRIEAAGAYHQFKKIDEIADAKRRDFRSARAGIPEATPAFPSGVEAKGELRMSALFPPGSSPQRYRLVDPTVTGGKTIAYVEIPEQSPIKAAEFVGRYVGVRALERRVQTGGVDPVPIYIASELIPLEAPGTQKPTETGQ